VRLREVSPEQQAEESIMSGKKNRVTGSARLLGQKQRLAQPLATWVVDAWVGGTSSENLFGYEYYVRFVCKATSKRRTYGCRTKKGFAECLRLHVRWVRSVKHLTEHKHIMPPGTLDIRIIASDMDSSFGTIRGATRSIFDDVVVTRGLLRFVTTKGDSNLTGRVESTFVSVANVNSLMARRGAPKQYFPDALAFHDQFHGQLMTDINYFGGGEAPDVTLGLEDIRHRLHPCSKWFPTRRHARRCSTLSKCPRDFRAGTNRQAGPITF